MESASESWVGSAIENKVYSCEVDNILVLTSMASLLWPCPVEDLARNYALVYLALGRQFGPKNPPHPSHSGESFSKNCTWRSLWLSVDEQTAPLAFGDSSFEESTTGDSGACARVRKKDLHCLHFEVFQTPAPATPNIPGNSSQLRGPEAGDEAEGESWPGQYIGTWASGRLRSCLRHSYVINEANIYRPWSKTLFSPGWVDRSHELIKLRVGFDNNVRFSTTLSLTLESTQIVAPEIAIETSKVNRRSLSWITGALLIRHASEAHE